MKHYRLTKELLIPDDSPISSGESLVNQLRIFGDCVAQFSSMILVQLSR